MRRVTVTYHRVAREHFESLATGASSSGAMAELAGAEYSKNLLMLQAIAAAGRGDETVRAGCALLARVESIDPGAVRTVISHPSFGAWAQHVLRGTGPSPRQLAAVAAAAAIRAGVQAEIEVPAGRGHVVMPTLGAAAADGTSATVRTTSGGAEIGQVTIGGPGWVPLRRVKPGARELLIDDVDPYRMPAVPTLAPRLSDAQAREWERSLGDAWALLRTHHPDTADEVDAAVTVLVPHATPDSGHSSATTAETFGAVALSEPTDTCRVAESLTHEVQHLKLFALLDVVTMTLPDEQLYYAPWRPDPRPLTGLLQGAYAFLGVSGFWRRQRFLVDDELSGHTEFAKWLDATWLVIQTLLGSGMLTPAGADFVQGMARTARGWRKDPVPERARAAAAEQARSHRERWERENAVR
jgi:HEXXH motif-containing protein